MSVRIHQSINNEQLVVNNARPIVSNWPRIMRVIDFFRYIFCCCSSSQSTRNTQTQSIRNPTVITKRIEVITPKFRKDAPKPLRRDTNHIPFLSTPLAKELIKDAEELAEKLRKNAEGLAKEPIKDTKKLNKDATPLPGQGETPLQNQELNNPFKDVEKLHKEDLAEDDRLAAEKIAQMEKLKMPESSADSTNSAIKDHEKEGSFKSIKTYADKIARFLHFKT